MTELVVRRVNRPWFHPDIIYRLTKDGKRHAECLSILHGFTNRVRTAVWQQQYIGQGLQHNFWKILFKTLFNVMGLYVER